MINLDYFGLGWRSESIARELTLLKNKKGYQPKYHLIKNSLEMLSELEKSFTIDDMLENWEVRMKYNLVLRELRKPLDPYEPVRSLAKIRRIKLAIGKINSKEKVSNRDIKISLDFFNKLSEVCLSKSSIGLYGESLGKSSSIKRFAA